MSMRVWRVPSGNSARAGLKRGLGSTSRQYLCCDSMSRTTDPSRWAVERGQLVGIWRENKTQRARLSHAREMKNSFPTAGSEATNHGGGVGGMIA